MMRITITGPRSVGKTSISKIVARKLKLKYISSDEIGDKSLKKYGGLDKAIKSGIIMKILKKEGFKLISKIYEKDNFVFDLSGGSVSSSKLKKASKNVRKIANKKSIVIGLLPSKKVKESINFLFKREKNRKHFRGMDNIELLDKVREHYIRMPILFKSFCDYIIYVKGKSKNNIAKEITQFIAQ